MIIPHAYPIWNGKKVIGTYYSSFKLFGKFIVIPRISTFKQPYGRRIQSDQFPISLVHVSDDGVRVIYDRMIDVRRKSKRQIAVVFGASG